MARPDQVDSKVPRGKAAFHTLLPLAGFLIGQPAPTVGKAIVALTGLVMTVSVIGGPKWSLFGRLFQQVIRPALKIGPGTREAAAPHRFAETMGAIFLVGATVAFLGGVAWLGWALTLIVVALAALNWLAGICVGCQMYPMVRRFGARFGSRAARGA